jgi:hypothetical protein
MTMRKGQICDGGATWAVASHLSHKRWRRTSRGQADENWAWGEEGERGGGWQARAKFFKGGSQRDERRLARRGG